jgi:hypothetical protein
MRIVTIRFIVLLVVAACISLQSWATEIYVSVRGNDTDPGTKEQPLATVAMALRKARELRRLKDPSIENGIRIIVEDGTYFFTETLFIRPEDSGTETSPTTIEADKGASPVFSGGSQLIRWTMPGPDQVAGLPAAAIGKIWVASAGSPMTTSPYDHNFRQLWINDRKAVRARFPNGDSMSRILSWNHADEACTIPIQNETSVLSGAAEMVIHQWWAIAILRIRSVKYSRDNAVLSFYQPESRIQSEHPWPAPWISKETGNSAFYLTNDISFLDQPGEWFFDTRSQAVYYYPRSGENMSSASVVFPRLETIVKLEGTIDHPVSHVYFNGISFQHTGWLRPSQQGHVPHQAGMYMLDAYKLKIPGTPAKASLENQAWVGRPAAAVEASYTYKTGFENCSFKHLASTGLDYKRGNKQDVIKGNLFKDIGGSAILAGVFSDEGTEVHIPYMPSDEREITSHAQISNNLITDVTNEDWGCVGIGAGYVQNINIEHNEICEVSYSGISVGWGWTKTKNAMRDNRITANKIHHYAKHLYDVAGIYTLSAQPGTIISENYIDSIYVAPYAHLPSHWFYLYTDEGTSNVTVKDNWCPSQKFLRNSNGPGNLWINNGPMVSESIKKSAGLQAKYQYLVKDKIYTPSWRINSFKGDVSESTPNNRFAAANKPLILEVITGRGLKVNEGQFVEIFKSQNTGIEFFKWNNHLVALGNIRDTLDAKAKINAQFPGAQIKIYSDMFYTFDRTLCKPDNTEAEWTNILLTANLLKNTGLQNEYLDYHSSQFDKWPEVSKGFCNASFQQLLLFKNDRQLMLVISIPKGKSLDDLNPKTTENNPRVDEWNALMKKYQEGIAGTKPGETWVFLNPIAEKSK